MKFDLNNVSSMKTNNLKVNIYKRYYKIKFVNYEGKFVLKLYQIPMPIIIIAHDTHYFSNNRMN